MEKHNYSVPRDVFMYLLAIITLVATAISLGSVLFDFINIYLPDVTQTYSGYYQSIIDSIRMGLATLIIVFPIFAWLTRLLNKDLASNPERRESKIRNWLLYLTLFVAASMIIGDLVAILRSFLSGELTVRFILKAAVILAIAGSSFFYYFSYLRWKNINWANILAKVVMAVVVITVIFGFYVSGSPFKSRSEKMDQTRVSDLQMIQNQIINYWQLKLKIPDNLNQLNDSISGYRVPVDPETGVAYEYVRGQTTSASVDFQLCAVFKTNTLVNPYGSRAVTKPVTGTNVSQYNLDNWDHDAGRFCFMRIIDKQLYPPMVTPVPFKIQ